MSDASQYTALITLEHADKPKYMAMVSLVAQCFCDQQRSLGAFVEDFDLDQAVGDQLDIIGEWVGISRRVDTPLSNVYFSLDIASLGFDQGSWQGPFDPATGITLLDDDTYRIILRAKIGSNHWDGSLEESKAILDKVFKDGTHLFIQDNQDMSMTFGISGELPSAVFLSLLYGGYLPIKPCGVRVSDYMLTSENGAAIFGFDMSSPYVEGFDKGTWGVGI